MKGGVGGAGDELAILTYRRSDADSNIEAAGYIIAIIAVIRAKPLLYFQSTMSGHGLMLRISLANTKVLGGIATACGVVVVVVMVVVVCPKIA